MDVRMDGRVAVITGASTGLGLAMAHGFASQSGGVLEIDSELGRGSTFSIVWPAGRVKS